MTEFLNNYWIVLAVTTAVSVLNGLSSRWSRKTGPGRWIGLAIDVLSFTTNRDAAGTLKIPGTTSR